MGSCGYSLQSQANLHKLSQLVNIDNAIFSSVDLWCVGLDVFTDLGRQFQPSR